MISCSACVIQSYKSCCFSPAGHMPPYSAPLIDMYKQANGIILGKMNLAELSTSIGSINPNIPGNNITTPLNPYNQTKIPGGNIVLHACTTTASALSNCSFNLLAAASSACLLQLCTSLHKQRNLVCVYKQLQTAIVLTAVVLLLTENTMTQSLAVEIRCCNQLWPMPVGVVYVVLMSVRSRITLSACAPI